MTDTALLSVEEMYQADAAAARAGVPGLALMEAAGTAVFREIRQRWPTPRPTVVLCGPGNNGGDGFVVARLLREAGWPVRLALLGDRARLKGDAAANARRWTGNVLPLDGPALLDGCELVVDALFGAGLARPLDGPARAVIEAINQRCLACLAVDVPSGVHGNTGQVMGAAPQATVTVTFFRAKPGHFLRPGRDLAGALVVADIGIPEAVLADIAPQTAFNAPGLWLERYPWPNFESNKYTRGHAVIAGGSEMTGAARLAARGARRIGAGLVTIATSPEAFPIYAADMPGTLVKPLAGRGGFGEFIADPRRNAVLVGPGAGVNEITHRRALAALAAGKATVLDADALTVFARKPKALFEAIGGPCVLTPHEGEFARLFKLEGDRLTRARAAARQSGAVVLLKGSDTVIAAPDGRAAIDASAPPELATGGSGDVLAGFVLGLLAQGMDAFGAACAATWVHGSAAADFGPGLIAEDLPERVPGVLRRLRAAAGHSRQPESE
ncbi:NAD(P)H-hydrate dehydratase [Shumkonia mesophila]|uniref:NAD(P)H-hydrate dehydratase n=1 Tax=Shumkonia mesophila TaxID=2838854 RepID=UPI002934DAEC|nr:NAD(P)H-hydrate dehydratase [Shumkonia mesophila]